MTSEQKLVADYLPHDFVEQHSDFEQYAIVYSVTMSKIYENSQNKKDIDTDPTLSGIDRYIKIREITHGKVVYRKCLSKSIKGLNKDKVSIGGRTWKELGLNDSQHSVIISASSFIPFYLRNSNKHIRMTARIGLIGFILTVVSSIITILSLIVELPLL